jgi:trehalose 6-phosphate phosphatase
MRPDRSVQAGTLAVTRRYGSSVSVEVQPEFVTARQALARCAPFLDRRPFLVVSDFDGTVSKIVLDPWGAEIVGGARRALRRMAAISGVHVTLLSGRLSRDVAARTRVGGATYIGNHGMELGRLRGGGRPESLEVEVVPVDEAFVSGAVELAAQVATAIPEPWLVVEAKPASVAFHFRGAPDVDAAAVRVRAAVESADPDRRFVRYAGRRVLELRPDGAPGKGEAMTELLAKVQPAAAIAMGDDVTDSHAFAVLRRARQTTDLGGLAIAVQARAEVPAEVLEQADIVLGSPIDASRFLAGLARSLASEGSDGA